MFIRQLISLVSTPFLCRCDLRFIACGDWGKSGDMDEVASCARKYAGSRDFTILLGDNFYPGGVTSVHDTQFHLFRDVVAAGSKIPHYLILGNIDYVQNARAQIEYS